MSVGAVILAAGKDMAGAAPKATMELSGTSVIKREVSILRDSGISSIVVVAGSRAGELEKHLAHRKVTVVENEEAEQGDMLTSVKKGLSALAGLCEKAVILPVDIPAFAPETIGKMEEMGSGREWDVIIPTYRGEEGHPIMICMDSAGKIAGFKESGGLQAMMSRGILKSLAVEVEDPGVVMELNRQEDSGEIKAYDKAMLQATPLVPEISVVIAREKPFFTREFGEFLREVDRTGSMNQACQKMGIAYSRAWKTINLAESQLGFPLIERLAGGPGGGSSLLTEEGRGWLDAFDCFIRRMDEEKIRLFHEIFGKWSSSG